MRYVDGDRFWEIVIDGNVVRTRFGAVGTAGEEAAKTWSDAARARAEADRQIATKLSRGFVPDGSPLPVREVVRPATPLREPTLEAAIVSRDDVDAYLVYADWLSERGDPRGELIALQAKKQDREAARLLADEREHLLGDLASLSETTLRVTWRLGFVDTVRLERVSHSEDDDDRSIGEMLSALLAHPSGAFVRELAVGTSDGVDDGNVSYESVVAALAEHRPAHLRRIHLGDWDEWEVSWSDAGDLTPLWSLPALDTLIVRAGAMQLGTIDAPALQRLDIITGGLDQDSVRAIARATVPALHTLNLWFGSQYYGATGTVPDLWPLLDGRGFPALRHLGLMNAEFTDELCAALAISKRLPTLHTLDLSKGLMSGVGAGSLTNIRHLASLDVSENYLEPTDLALLRTRCNKVVSTTQRSGDRYVVLGE